MISKTLIGANISFLNNKQVKIRGPYFEDVLINIQKVFEQKEWT